jgi:hypothetical protein
MGAVNDTVSGLNAESIVIPEKSSDTFGRPSHMSADDLTMDFRARLMHQQAENAARRKVDLAAQSSRLNSAEERIRIWERLHEVILPRDPAHRLVEIIAANTGLTDADVRDEQRRRAEVRLARAAGIAAPAPAVG